MEKVVKEFMQKGYLIDQSLVEIIDNPEINEVLPPFIEIVISNQPTKIITKEFFLTHLKNIINELESKSKVAEEKEKFLKAISYLRQLHIPKTSIEVRKTEKKKEAEDEKTFFKGVRVLEPFNTENKKIVVEDFVKYFRDRFNSIKPLLMEHNLKNLTSINKISGQRQNITIMGLVYNKRYTKNKNLFLEIEDPTGMIRVLVRRDKEELFQKAEEIVLDEMVAFSCSGSDEILFANDVFFPEAVLKERKKYDKEVYAIFTADMHVGSNKFLEKNFLKFVDWINGKIGSEKQKEIAKKVKYLFIAGDLVDGVGIYPGQRLELDIDDIYNQYDRAAELLSKVRKDLTIIICPGNHDAVSIVEPQPAFNEKITKKLSEMENVILLTNPCFVNIASTKKHPGFNVFMYHGASFDYYANNLDVIRTNKPYRRPEIVVNLLLKKRHIAPTHTSTRYFPCERDSLVIRKVPDVFVMAHIHKSSVSRYNNILFVSCSSWQPQTPYQEKFGHEPDPCKVPIFNLKTGKVNIIDFS